MIKFEGVVQKQFGRFNHKTCWKVHEITSRSNLDLKSEDSKNNFQKGKIWIITFMIIRIIQKFINLFANNMIQA